MPPFEGYEPGELPSTYDSQTTHMAEFGETSWQTALTILGRLLSVSTK